MSETTKGKYLEALKEGIHNAYSKGAPEGYASIESIFEGIERNFQKKFQKSVVEVIKDELMKGEKPPKENSNG
jgi:hypothetical protein